MLKALIAHPLTRNQDLDDPQTTTLRRRIIREKRFLENIYLEWYSMIVSALPPGCTQVLELGSGGGFLSEILPRLITSEVFLCPGINVVLDGREIPITSGNLDAIVMVDVLHHISDPRRFFTSAARCVRLGGSIIMIEPWVSPWSRFVYQRLHHEPFLPEVVEWEFPSSGPLSGANSALPWILFERDRSQFEREFLVWKVQEIERFMPLRYLLSGGVSLRSLSPAWSFNFWREIEEWLKPWMGKFAMFAKIVLQRIQ